MLEEAIWNMVGLTHRTVLYVVKWILQSVASKLLLEAVNRVQLGAFNQFLRPEVYHCSRETQVRQCCVRQRLMKCHFEDLDLQQLNLQGVDVRNVDLGWGHYYV